MKNIAKFFKKNRTCFKVISMILVLALMIQMVSIAVTAITNSNEDILNPIDTESPEITLSEIVCEVESKRNRYTKVYKLSDGSYYEINSSKPIHENINDMWEEPTNDLNTPNNVNEATAYCETLADLINLNSENGIAPASLDLEINDFAIPNVNTRVIDKNGNSYDTKRVQRNRICLLWFDSYFPVNSSYNQITKRCILTLNCQDVVTGTLSAYCITEPWDATNESLKSNDIEYKATITDSASIVTPDPNVSSSVYAMFDITDMCLKWEKGYVDNNGLVFKFFESNAAATISGCTISRQYIMVDSYDSDFSYHTIDMGRAGDVYINDFTNSVLLVRKELGFESEIQPVTLYRYFDFGKTHTELNPSGHGARWNYTSNISMVTSRTYLWETFDGSSIEFILTGNNIFSDIEFSGYTMTLPANYNSTRNLDGTTIVTPDNIQYVFDTAGKVKKITDEYGDSIDIVYVNNLISYIEDGLGRRYYFTYSKKTYDVNDIEKVSLDTLVSIDFRTPDNYETAAVIGNQTAKIEYTYTLLNNNFLALTECRYPDGKTVSYTYNSDGQLLEIKDEHNRKLVISYTSNIPSYSIGTGNSINTTYKEVNQYPSVTLLEEYVKNTEGDSSLEGYETYLLKNKIEIDRHNNYQRTFKFNDTETEKIHYNSDLRVLYYESTNGETFYADYSNINGVSELSQIVSPENKASEIEDYNFEIFEDVYEVYDSWGCNDGSALSLENGTLSGYGEQFIRVSGSTMANREVTKIVEISGEAGEIFVVGAHARANAPVPAESHFFGIEIYKCVYDSGNRDYQTTDELLYRMAFDSTIDYESQFRLGAFLLDEHVDAFEYRFVYSYQSGWADFDEVLFYESSTDNVTIVDNSQSTPTTYSVNTNSSSTSTRKTEINNITTNGTTTMLTQYKYDPNNGFLSEYTDSNNVVTEFVYDDTGMLIGERVHNGTDASSYITYSYTALGALSEVSSVVSTLSGENKTLSTSYSYDGDRIETVSHNGSEYTFEYNSFGNIKTINVKSIAYPAIVGYDLESYDYSNDRNQTLNSITYSNGEKITYTYDANTNRVKTISRSDKENHTPVLLYEYEYDLLGNVTQIKDYASNRTTIYSSTGFIVKEGVSETPEGETENILYSVTKGSNGEINENLFGINYSYKTNEAQIDDETSETTYSSEYIIYETDTDTLTINSSSVSDYFGRFKSSEIEYSRPDSGELYKIKNSAEYKNYTAEILDDSGNTVPLPATSSLIENYTSEIKKETSDNTETTICSFVSSYEYDDAGRITHIKYGNSQDDLILASYFEYDGMGQLINEVDISKMIYTHYEYNSGGNIVNKTIYTGGDSFTFDTNTDEITIAEDPAEVEVKTFTANEQVPDALEEYNDRYIALDEYGNPTRYYRGPDGDEERFDLKWNGNLLDTVEADDGEMRYKYFYDSNGLRTKKITYSVTNPGANDEAMQVEQVLNYIWDEDKVVGYNLYVFNDGEPITINTKVLYDENDSPIGMKYSSSGFGEDVIVDGDGVFLADDDIFWFIKDGQGNIKAIYSEKAKYTVGCSFDSTGTNLSVSLSENFVDKVLEKLDSVEGSAKYKLILGLVYVLSAAAITYLTIDMAQTTYKGYIMDIETGLFYCQNRYYSPEWGRYISIDSPINLTQNMENPLNGNSFVYCNNDPVNGINNAGKGDYNLSGVGIQAEMSSLFPFATGEMGIEMIYCPSRDELYSYSYGNINESNVAVAVEKLQYAISKTNMSNSVSLKNLSTWFKLKHSINLSFFTVNSNNSFTLPISYAGAKRYRKMPYGQLSGYETRTNGCLVRGVTFSPVGRFGFAFSNGTSNYKMVEFSPDNVKSYLSSNVSTIKNTTK